MNFDLTEPCGPPALQPTLHRRAVLGTGFSAYAVHLPLVAAVCPRSLCGLMGALTVFPAVVAGSG
jgi:hypothetical protein